MSTELLMLLIVVSVAAVACFVFAVGIGVGFVVCLLTAAREITEIVSDIAVVENDVMQLGDAIDNVSESVAYEIDGLRRRITAIEEVLES